MPPATPKTRVARPKRPAHLPHGRWLGDFTDLSNAEKRLVEDCAIGVLCTLGTARPETATTANTIRAGLIRFLVLGGDDAHPVHENGVQLEGAWIEDRLKLDNVTATALLRMSLCRFAAGISSCNANLPSLCLDGSQTTDLAADWAVVAGSLHLRNGFTATGQVRLVGAQIGGDLICRGASFRPEGTDGFALDAALKADVMVVKGTLFLRRASLAGGVSLIAAQAFSLVDDEDCWPRGDISVDGFRYGRIAEGRTEAASRINWLQRQIPEHLGTDFRPQPWEQLIKVLREMGHPADAAEVAIAKQLALRKAGKIGNRLPRTSYVGWRLGIDRFWAKVSNWVAWCWHWAYGALAGFGYRPARILIWMIGLCLLSGWYFSVAAASGVMAPASSEIFAHKQIHADLKSENTDGANCGIQREVAPIYYWTRCSALPSEYTTFNPWVYSLDLILPLVDLQQDTQWAPASTYTDPSGTVRNLPAGMLARGIMWFEILFGWFASLMFVAIAGRLVEKD